LQNTTLLDQALQAAVHQGGVAVLTLPGDVGSMTAPDPEPTQIVKPHTPGLPDAGSLAAVVRLIDEAERVTMLVGMGAREARDEVLALAERLSAPMVLTLKAKEGLERDNPFEVGQSGLIGNPAASDAFESCDLLMVGTDFPYMDWYPKGKTVVQIDTRGEHIGRRVRVQAGLVGHSAPTVHALHDLVAPKTSDAATGHLSSARLGSARETYTSWHERQSRLADPRHDRGLVGRLRRTVDNSSDRIRPELLAQVIDRHAADDAIFTADTGMATVWLSRFVTMRGTRRLLGSFNLGSMANAMPQALGAQALDRDRQVVAFCGDGGLTMLLGDLLTAVSADLHVKLVVFDNGRLGMVKLEQEQGGLPEFGTVLANPDLAAVARAIGFHGIRVTDPANVEQAVIDAFAHPGPVLVDVLTNPEEISVPGKLKLDQAWGFAIAKVREGLLSEGDS